MQRPTVFGMDSLTTDLLKEIFKKIPAAKLPIKKAVCRRWQKILSEDKLWEEICKINFGNPWKPSNRTWEWVTKAILHKISEDNKLVTTGFLLQDDGNYLCGDWNETEITFGFRIWVTGDAYIGEFAHRLPSGVGKMIWENGETYEGGWKEGKREGKGVYQFLNRQYDGEWVANQQHGFGKMRWNKGDYYEGEWANDTRIGYGKYSWAEGDVYNGQWKNQLRDGIGQYVWSDGRKCFGMWKENIREGCSIYTWLDGSEYSGDFKDNKRHGKGIMKWPDGIVYSGEWINDERVGDTIERQWDRFFLLTIPEQRESAERFKNEFIENKTPKTMK